MIGLVKKSFLGCLLAVLFSCAYDNVPSPPSNPCENELKTVYTDQISYFTGDEVNVFFQSSKSHYCGLRIYNSKNEVVFTTKALIYPQTIVQAEPWKNGLNLKGTVQFTIPMSLPSGVYYIDNKVPIVVKSRDAADVTVVYPTNTINAYTNSGGKSLYGHNSTNNISSAIVSFKRPQNDLTERSHCIECMKWFLNQDSFSFRYIGDVDLDTSASLLGTKLLIIVGHSEYWTRKARNNFDDFVNQGGNVLVLSGNTMWWQVRYSPDGTQMICYKEPSDPCSIPAERTVYWNDPSLNYPIALSIGSDFDNGGYGLNKDNGWDGYKIVNGTSPLFEGLKLKRGDIIKLPSGECDGAPISSFDSDGFPILNNKFSFDKLELIGFDKGSRYNKETYPTFIAFKKSAKSGIVINVGSNDWCSPNGIGNHAWGAPIRTITHNAISKLLNGDRIFSDKN